MAISRRTYVCSKCGGPKVEIQAKRKQRGGKVYTVTKCYACFRRYGRNAYERYKATHPHKKPPGPKPNINPITGAHICGHCGRDKTPYGDNWHCKPCKNQWERERIASDSDYWTRKLARQRLYRANNPGKNRPTKEQTARYNAKACFGPEWAEVGLLLRQLKKLKKEKERQNGSNQDG